jgi:hypothetical protein
MPIRVLLTLATVLLIAATALGYPKPAPVPVRPELTFRPGPLRMLKAMDDNWYWYFTYEVVNRTGRDTMWAPSLVLYTDRGEILPADSEVPRVVLQQISEYIGDPLLESRTEIVGTVRQGEGHARRGLAVWPAHRTDVNAIRLFVRGLSPEKTTIEHPVSGDRVTLRKTLQLMYLVPGDPRARGDDPVPEHPQARTEDRWIFR